MYEDWNERRSPIPYIEEPTRPDDEGLLCSMCRRSLIAERDHPLCPPSCLCPWADRRFSSDRSRFGSRGGERAPRPFAYSPPRGEPSRRRRRPDSPVSRRPSPPPQPFKRRATNINNRGPFISSRGQSVFAPRRLVSPSRQASAPPSRPPPSRRQLSLPPRRPVLPQQDAFTPPRRPLPSRRPPSPRRRFDSPPPRHVEPPPLHPSRLRRPSSPPPLPPSPPWKSSAPPARRRPPPQLSPPPQQLRGLPSDEQALLAGPPPYPHPMTMPWWPPYPPTGPATRPPDWSSESLWMLRPWNPARR